MRMNSLLGEHVLVLEILDLSLELVAVVVRLRSAVSGGAAVDLLFRASVVVRGVALLKVAIQWD